MNTDNNKHLHRLDELSDWKVASHDPDIRGWKVKDMNNRIVGKVDHLLVNRDLKKVLYLDIELDESILRAGTRPYNPYKTGVTTDSKFTRDAGTQPLADPLPHTGATGTVPRKEPVRTTHHDAHHDTEFVNEDGDTHVILPIGYARLIPDDDHVQVDILTYDVFAETKRYSPATGVNRDYEVIVLGTYDRNEDYTQYRGDEKVIYDRSEYANYRK